MYHAYIDFTRNRHNNDNNEEAEELDDDFLLPQLQSEVKRTIS